ncbi:segregation and condensation protein A [Stenoxybacter acetivorans]|uniref:segregation and condensation protein A n=1 Tax=Stenoxybacter acetivorans TaxID=422441 RepID=UPI00068C3A8A|nr:ScpA family protein [Stenoxybacter acetivorans]
MPSDSPLSTDAATAVAWVFGQPVADVPQDLFIPPDALQVVLIGFEGPLDLLLYLIRKQNLNVLDIPMIQITQQYLAYINEMHERELDLTAEYLLMAAILIEIKSRLLLPKPPIIEEETDDPRAELVRRLLQYEQIKFAAAQLDELPRAGRDFAWAYLPLEIIATPKPPQVSVSDLQQAWLNILARAKHQQHHQIFQEALSVRVQMSEILRRLQKEKSCLFSELFRKTDNLALVVVNFIAILELVKEGSIQICQSTPYEAIEIRVK